MKRSANSSVPGIVRSGISFYTYLNAAYHAVNSFLHRQSHLFNSALVQKPPVGKHHYRAKKHEIKTGAPVHVSGMHHNPSAQLHRRTA